MKPRITSTNNNKRGCRQQSGRLAGSVTGRSCGQYRSVTGRLWRARHHDRALQEITVTVSSEGRQLRESTLNDDNATNDAITVLFTVNDNSADSDIVVAFSVSGIDGAVEGSDYSVNGSSPVTIAAGDTDSQHHH